MTTANEVHFFDVMEKIMLDILSDRFMHRVTFDSHQEFEDLCMQRMRAMYDAEEIELLKSKVPKNFRPEQKEQQDILNELIAFTQVTFIPQTQSLRRNLKNQLNHEEVFSLQEIKKQYLVDLERLTTQKKGRIIEQSDQMSEPEIEKELMITTLTYQLDQLTPNVMLTWKQESDWYLKLYGLVQKCGELQSTDLERWLDLYKERIQIHLGPLGNIMASIIPFNQFKDEYKVHGIMQLLLID